MKNNILIIGLISLFFISTSVLAKVNDSKVPTVTDTSWIKVSETGVLVIGLDDTFAPMGFRDAKGKMVGFDVDLAREVALRLKLRPIFLPCVWSSIFLELKGCNIDMIQNGVSMNSARKEQALFSRPYLVNRMVIVIAKTSKDRIKKRGDLVGKKIAVQSGSPAFDYVKNYKGNDFDPASLKELVQYPDNYSALFDLSYKGVDAVVLDEIVADYYITRKKVDLLKISDTFATEKYGIAFRKGDKALCDKVQETLDAMGRDGTAAKISKKWFGRDVFRASSKLLLQSQAKHNPKQSKKGKSALYLTTKARNLC